MIDRPKVGDRVYHRQNGPDDAGTIAWVSNIGRYVMVIWDDGKYDEPEKIVRYSGDLSDNREAEWFVHHELIELPATPPTTPPEESQQ